MSWVEDKYIKMYILETHSYVIAIMVTQIVLRLSPSFILSNSNNWQEMWQSSDFTHISEIYHEYPYFKKSTFLGYSIFILGYFALYNRMFTADHDCQIWQQ